MRFAVCLLLISAPSSFAAPPIVAGFERFHTTDSGNSSVGGQLLLGELNCTACHATGEKNPAATRKQAPILDGIGFRVRIAHLRKFLADPAAVKPGTTMPAVLTDDPDRAEKVEALIHFLVGTGGLRHERPDPKSIALGRDLYAKVGCAACHGPRDAKGGPQSGGPSYLVPLGDVVGKYSLPSLTTFLSDPLKVRPAGRMPYLLTGKDAKDVASYLLQGVSVNLPSGVGTTSYSYFEGDWDKLPDFARLKPKATGRGAAFDLSPAQRGSNYAMRFEGVFNADRTGSYRFHLHSDDGSRLLIDGRKVVDNDGVHPPQSKSGDANLTKGLHTVVVEFMQASGGAELDVQVEPPGLARQPFSVFVAESEAALEKKPVPMLPVDPDNTIEFNPALAKKGKEVFLAVGCVNCHQFTPAGKPTNLTEPPALAALKGTGGCLAEKPAKGVPVYGLSPAQRTALTAALKKPEPPATDSTTVIARTMLTLNCYACHVRDKVGGPTEFTNALFQTTQPEMGDEGRVPPPLDNVGAKLTPEYLSRILHQGANDRPYMHTRMPGFGQANAGHLTAAFGELDKFPVVPPVSFTDTVAKVKAAGRFMVGAQALGCITCHTFAGQKAQGVQGIDMTLMPKRLKRDWYFAYLDNPQKVRPGTRMPTAWPNGQSVLPNVLDGKAATQIEAIWVYLSSDKPTIPAGMGKSFIPLTPTEGAIIYRNFIQGAGARGIGVGYPEKLNLAFDANDMRLAMIWQGGFIDAARHWTDRGVGFEGPLGDNVVSLPPGAAFAVLKSDADAWPAAPAKEQGYKFLGYTLTTDDRPTFRYSFNGVTVEDFSNPSGKENTTLKRTLTLTTTTPPTGLVFRVAVASKIEAGKDGWFVLDGVRIRLSGAPPRIRQSDGKAELLVPVTFKEGKATITEEFAW